MSKLFSLFAFLGLVISMTALSGCTNQSVQASAPPVSVASAEEYRLGAGDKIRLSLYGDDTFNGEFQVSENGTVSLPLIGAQQAGGKTIAQFRRDVEVALGNGFYNDPRISAEVINFRPFYIYGEVNKPGEYPYVAGLTLGKAVAMAGGYTYRANEKVLSLQRAGMEDALRVPSAQGLEVGPGDTIQILERYF